MNPMNAAVAQNPWLHATAIRDLLATGVSQRRVAEQDGTSQSRISDISLDDGSRERRIRTLLKLLNERDDGMTDAELHAATDYGVREIFTVCRSMASIKQVHRTTRGAESVWRIGPDLRVANADEPVKAPKTGRKSETTEDRILQFLGSGAAIDSIGQRVGVIAHMVHRKVKDVKMALGRLVDKLEVALQDEQDENAMIAHAATLNES